MCVTQAEEWIVHFSEDGWFVPQLFQSACCTVLVHDTEPQIAPYGCAISILSVCVCVCVCLLVSRLVLYMEALLLLYK